MNVVVFLVGEGPTDIGDLAGDPVYRSSKARQEGFLQPLVRRLANAEFELAFAGQKLHKLARRPIPDLGQALASKSAQAMALASYSRADILVIVTDVDREHGAHRSIREARRRIGALTKAIEQGAGKQADLPFAVGTPCRTVEAWALADPDAVEAISPSGEQVERHGKPEHLWGSPREPASKHPKRILERAFGGELKTGHYAEIAERVDLDRVRERCPCTFPPFADQILAACREATG